MSASPKEQIAYKVDGQFVGKKPGKAAKDLSGVACMPPRADGSRVCLFVNDESGRAQFATLKGKTITPGPVLELIGDEAHEGFLGVRPELEGAEDAEFGEFDGEGVAYAAPYFYIAGSHGRARKSGDFALSSFLVGRVKVDDDGRPVDADGKILPEARWPEAVELTYRLSDLLRQAEPVAPFFGKLLDAEENGLNVEGVAVDGKRLLAGLRAPSLDGKAYLVGADLAALFAPGHAPAEGTPEVTPLSLGESMGIRDLAQLPDGRLVVLAGPAQEQPLPFKVFVAGPTGTLIPIGELDAVEDEDGDPAKAEAMTVLGADGGTLRLLVLFDGLKNGAPVELRFPLPQR
ncbi:MULTISPECIES: DUF3616 domain-containing protein [Rhodomicrobium]|uniref:DUF3616 domain-containing protein n=1 Tax=Rhodomicrobium TaxID=1068 RepID=UPI001FD9E788|nr:MULTISPECIES: DUF3616 domain-containing protein [Rhodomicrobium]